MAGRQHHTGPLEVAPAGGAFVFLSFVTVPRTATVETAGLAVVAVVIVTMGPGGTATVNTEETPGVAGAGLVLLSAVVAASGGTAPARVEVASTGAGEVGPGSVLVALGTDVGSGGASRPGPILTASEATATFCWSSSLSEATRGVSLDTHTFQAHGEAGPRVLSGP